MTEIIQPKPKFSCPRRVVICATKPDLHFFVKTFDLRPDARIFLARLYRREDIAFAGPVLGGPQMAILLENLMAAGGEEFLFFGWAGALTKDLPLGSLFLPEEAVSAEGTSAHYPSPLKPSRDLFWEIYHALIQSGLDFEVGRAVSTDALYRETEEFVQTFSPRAQVVDMETASAFSVAGFRQRKLASLLFISDRVFPERETAGKKEFLRMREAVLPLFRYFWSPI